MISELLDSSLVEKGHEQMKTKRYAATDGNFLSYACTLQRSLFRLHAFAFQIDWLLIITVKQDYFVLYHTHIIYFLKSK